MKKELEIKLEKIKKGILKGNLDQLICKYQPDFENMIVGEMSTEDVTADYIKLAQYQGSSESLHLWHVLYVIFICLGGFLLGKVAQKLKSRK